MPAPVAYIAYRRPDHVRRTLAALRANPEAADTVLYVFSDGPRDDAVADAVAEVRAAIRAARGFAKVEIVERERNLGLARNITGAVTDLVSQHGEVIVVEDDVLVSPHFLKFMNDGLAYYRDEPRVGSINGYTYPVRAALPETYFIKGGDCWGWATWRDRWTAYDADGRRLLDELRARGLTHSFDFDGEMPFTDMLGDQIAGRNDSWAVRWHASCYLRDMLALYPGRSLVQNIGFDATGTHATSRVATYDVEMSDRPITVGGIDIAESDGAREAIKSYFRASRPKPTVLGRARQTAGRALRTLGLRRSAN